MKKNNIILAIVPARKNSRGIKNKNIIKIKNKLLINHTLGQAINCKEINQIVVTSDSEKILNKSLNNKKIIKIQRPKNLASSNSSINDTIDHSLNFLKKNYNIIPEIILLLEPTSPLRKVATIKRAIKILRLRKTNTLIPVSKTKEIFGELRNKKFFPFRKIYTNRQRRKNSLVVNSSIWGCKYSYFKKNKKILSSKPYPIYVEFPENLDLNEKKDLYILKKIMEK